MTRTPAARGRRGKEVNPRSPDAEAIPPKTYPPLVPRRKLFVALMIVIAAWVTALLVMYFTTVAR